MDCGRSRCCADRLIIMPLPARRVPLPAWWNSNAGSRKRQDVNEDIRAAAQLQTVCETNHWQYCFIGGLALQRWGEPRETVDVDLTLLTGFGGESPYVEELLRHFAPRVPDTVEFALTHRVLLVRAASGVGLDIALGGLPFEQQVVARSSMFTFPPDVPLRTCSAECLIVLKAFAARPKDWLDVEGIIIRQTGQWTSLARSSCRFLRYSSRPGPRLFDGDRTSMIATNRRCSTSRIST